MRTISLFGYFIISILLLFANLSAQNDLKKWKDGENRKLQNCADEPDKQSAEFLKSECFNQLDTLHQKADDAFNEGAEDLFTLRFYNALTGSPVQGASVTIDQSDSYITDNDGKVAFKIPESEDSLDVLFQNKGYITTHFKVEIMAGSIFFNRFSVSPSILKGTIRIVLDWGSDPQDLDAHLIKQGDYHVSYRNMHSSSDGKAILDHDATYGYGPETITINLIDNDAVYDYFVHNYSERNSTNSSGLARSNATVKVYDSQGLHRMYKIQEQKSGTYWDVFRIENGEIEEVNRIKN